MKKLWDFVSNIGYHDNLSHEEARRIKILCRLNGVSFTFLLIYIVIELLAGITTFVLPVFFMLIFVLIDLYLLHIRKYLAAKHFSITVMTACIGFFVVATGESFSEALFIALVAMPLVIFKEKKLSLFYLFFIILSFIVVKYAQQNCVEPLLLISPDLILFFRVLNVVSSCVLTYFITFYFKSDNESYEAKLVHVNELITERNKEVLDSITYAKRIQTAILPSQKMIKGCFENSFVVYLPKDIVAGDFYWLEKIGDKIIFAVCDCTGHGVPGAMVSVVCSNALNRTVKEFGVTDPGKILDKVRELVLETFEKSENEVTDGMDASMFTLDLKTKECKWAGAYNSLYVISPAREYSTDSEQDIKKMENTFYESPYSSSANGCLLKEIKADKQPIGKCDSPSAFTTHSIKLNKGDCIYLFTDGYADQFGGPKGKKFKYKQLEDLLLTNCQLPMEEQKKIMERTFENWKGNLEQVDDVCLVGITI